MYIDYCSLWNRLWKLRPWDLKIIQEAHFFDWRWHLYTHRLLLTEKLLMKTESLMSQKWFSTPIFKADAEIFNVHRLLLAQKPFTKTRTLDQKIIQEAQFYGWRWHLLRTQTPPDWETVDENWVPPVLKIILETHFYGWRWNLQCT